MAATSNTTLSHRPKPYRRSMTSSTTRIATAIQSRPLLLSVSSLANGPPGCLWSPMLPLRLGRPYPGERQVTSDLVRLWPLGWQQVTA